MSEDLRRAMDAIRAGKRSEALDLLARVIKDNPKSEDAWLWMASISATPTEQRECLEFVLTINPENQEARRGLAMLSNQASGEVVSINIQDAANVIPEPIDINEDTTPTGAVERDLVQSFSKTALDEGHQGTQEFVESGTSESSSAKRESSISRSRGNWRRWFQLRSESDIARQFPRYVDELLSSVSGLDSSYQRHIDSLQFAKERHASATPETGTMIYLSPGVQAATSLAEGLEAAGHHADAFWAANIFGEMCKILVERNRKRYQEHFERLLFVAISAIVSPNAIGSEMVARDSQGGEFDKLRHQLEQVCRFALGTYFQNRSGNFIRNWQPDTALGERITSEVLAQHFDHVLRYLLQHDRPRVREYVTENLPLVYKLRLADKWDATFLEWEKLLAEAGYDDLIRYLRSAGLLIRVDKVGQLSSERWGDVRRAAANNDINRVRDLLRDSADELKSYLYAEAQSLLDYRQPPQPHISDRSVQDMFSKAKHLSEKGDPQRLQEATGIMQSAWERDIGNMELRDWVAYLQAKSNNPKAAEPILEHIRRRRDSKHNLTTIWNLAVLAYDRKDEAAAYNLLIPLLEREVVDEDLVFVALALSLKLGDREKFLAIVPQTLSLRFHPLAFVVAHDLGDKRKEEELLAQLLRQSQEKWELPPVAERFASVDLFQGCVNKAIVAGQVDQLVSWLETRIAVNKGWMPNYIALARVLEEEKQDINGAFEVLAARLERSRGKDKDPRRLDEAGRDLLDFCRRTKRKDLGLQAYEFVRRSGASGTLLDSFALFAPVDNNPEEEIGSSISEIPARASMDEKSPVPVRDPQLAERLAWVTARLSMIRSLALYIQEGEAVREFCRIISEMRPQESGTLVKMIEDISEVVQIFSHTGSDDHDTRRVLYDRAISYESRLGELLTSGALSRALQDVITPYYEALKQVVGDLSRQAGVGPNLEVAIENAFVSLESMKSTIALRITNVTERPVSDIQVEVLAEDHSIVLRGRRERQVPLLQSRGSALLSFAFERSAVAAGEEVSELGFGISLRASAEGFPNVDLGITKRRLPVRKFKEAIGLDQIPRLFQSGKPLNPSDPTLFQGREDIIQKIGSSFFGGVQRERFFLDGIRRVGKTSVLNFLPLGLPSNIFPIFLNLDTFGLRGPTRSSVILRQICSLIKEDVVFRELGVELRLPSAEEFEESPGRYFSSFLQEARRIGGRTPLVMIDEFQELLYAIARSGSSHDRDTLVLDQLRGHSDEGGMYVIFTGSVRFDRLSSIIDHRIFGSLTRLRISFLSEESVGEVLRAGVGRWASIPREAIRKVYELTGGYPWLVQTYGAGIVDRLNRERRGVVTPEDIDGITNDEVLCSDELFKYWWPDDQLLVDEERFVEWLLRKYPSGQAVSSRDFFSTIHNRELPVFRRAFENLRACEVLDSTQTETLKFSGDVMRRWLQQKMQDGQLRVRTSAPAQVTRGEVGIFIDHENFVKSLERISRARGVDWRADRLGWFSRVLKKIMEEVERRIGRPKFRVAVAFWERPHEAALLPIYFQLGFNPAAPEPVKMENAVDFKVASEVRRAKEQALREGGRLGCAIVVTGDGDLSHEARSLVNDGVAVEIWGGSRETNEAYRQIVGEDRVIAIDDVSGL